jgi:hypothetical protein
MTTPGKTIETPEMTAMGAPPNPTLPPVVGSPPLLPPPCNARSLAQEVASWYLDHLDDQQTHAENIERCLRRPIGSLTVLMLQKKLSSQTLASTNGNRAEIGSTMANSTPKKPAAVAESWREYLQCWDEKLSLAELFLSPKVLNQYASLSLRTRARTEAFLEGILFSVAMEDSPPSNGSIQRALQHTSGEGTDLSLTQGLVGLGGSTTATTPPPTILSAALSKRTRNGSIGSSRYNRKYPQISEGELVARTELYLRSLQRVADTQSECIIAQESSRALKARVHFVVAAFVESVGTVQHVGPVLTALLSALTRELLSVGSLSESLQRSIQNIVSNYVHTTSFASLAFLSSPETSAERRLSPAIWKYLLHLQKQWKHHQSECEMEILLETSLDSHMRSTFKTAEFQSIGHLLEVCQGYRDQLQSIRLPDRNENGMCDTEQALKDLHREVIAVNGSVLPHVTDREDLLQLLNSALNTRPFFDGKSRRRSNNKKKKNRKPPNTSKSPKADEDNSESSNDNGSSGDDGDLSSDSGVVGGDDTQNSLRRYGKFKLSTVDLLTKRILIATSRTGTGGDAYFVVRDLFGGEDVEVVPSQQYAYMAMIHPPTIDLIVRLASVTIKCHGSFDVYPKSLVGDCEPLIQIHTTTTESIGLQEVRGDDGMVLQERPIDSKGQRTLSVRPALYEKISVWHTPS